MLFFWGRKTGENLGQRDFGRIFEAIGTFRPTMSTSRLRSTWECGEVLRRVTFILRDGYDSHLMVWRARTYECCCSGFELDYERLSKFQASSRFFSVYLKVVCNQFADTSSQVCDNQHSTPAPVLPRPVVLPRLEPPLSFLCIFQILPLSSSIRGVAPRHIDQRLRRDRDVRIIVDKERL